MMPHILFSHHSPGNSICSQKNTTFPSPGVFKIFSSEVSLTSYMSSEREYNFSVLTVLRFEKALGTSKLPLSWKWNYVASCCPWHIRSLKVVWDQTKKTSALSQSWWCCLRWRQVATLPLELANAGHHWVKRSLGLLHNWGDCFPIGPWGG